MILLLVKKKAAYTAVVNSLTLNSQLESILNMTLTFLCELPSAQITHHHAILANQMTANLSNTLPSAAESYTVQRTPVNLIGLVQEKNIIISGLSDYPVTIFY